MDNTRSYEEIKRQVQLLDNVVTSDLKTDGVTLIMSIVHS